MKQLEKVRKYITDNQMIEKNDLVVVGVSGGADSVCLFDMLCDLQEELQFALLVVHVNHMVREDAGQDAAYVEKLCAQRVVPFILREVDMEGYAEANGLSSEEAGRILRYEAFAECAKREAKGRRVKIAVAHTANDRAETLLFHLFRGSGLTGVTSIRPVRDQIIRPVLCLERREVEDYLAQRGLVFCEDSTNAGDAYTRNKIRHHIVDYAMQQVCSQSVLHMAQFAEDMTEINQYLNIVVGELFDRYVTQTDALSRPDMPHGLCVDIGKDRLCKEPEFLIKAVLLRCMEKLTSNRKDITRRHMDGLYGLLGTDGSKEMNLPYKITAIKEYERLYLGRLLDERNVIVTEAIFLSDIGERKEVVLPDGSVAVFELMENTFFQHRTDMPPVKSGEENIPQNRYTKWFDYDKISTCLSLRTRESSDYLTIDKQLHKTSIKQYMINEKIPKTERDKIYLLADGAHILWVPGYRISQYYKVDETTEKVLKVYLRGGKNG